MFMAVIKCKMCGGTLIIGNETVATCEYCGTQQTLPKPGSDRRMDLYERAGHYRRNNEFDKAMGIYEQILNEDPTDAESYWSLVLCRYGIEYVEDPATRKRIPTVNRTQFTSIYDDADYKSALQYADASQRKIYEAEADAINEILKGILAISRKEEPFDVFICYKETDQNGRRTPDSVLANELYHQLTQEGFKVFFSRITLEDKLGTAYEPYIFAALNSAKVMVVLGTRREFFHAVWVRNEWSRYLTLIRNGAKKTLIPAYRDMDPYDLPEEFSHLQAQDMGRLGFMQDMLRGIKKLTQSDAPVQTVLKETVITAGRVDVTALLKRAFLFLEDGDWNRADEFCEQALNIDPECAQGYLGKLMAEFHVRRQEDLKDCAEPFEESNNYRKALRFADDALRESLTEYADCSNARRVKQSHAEGILQKRKAANRKKLVLAVAAACLILTLVIVLGTQNAPQNRYKEAVALMEAGEYEEAIAVFASLSTYQDSEGKIAECETAMLERKYNHAVSLLDAGSYEEAIEAFEALNGYKDSAEQMTAATLGRKYCDAAARKDRDDILGALCSFAELGEYQDSQAQVAALRQQYAESLELAGIAAGNAHAVALKSDGSVTAAGAYAGNVSGWKNMLAVSAGANHTVGLKTDGTVLAAGSDLYGQCDVSGWKNMIAVSAGGNHTVGLKADGTVLAAGNNDRSQCNVSDWKDMIAVSAGDGHTVGLKADGTVVAVGSSDYGQCDVSAWENIIAVSAGVSHTVGLKADGTAVAAGRNSRDLCDVSGWENLVAVHAGSWHVAGLKADGTVVAAGYNEYGQCNVSDWKDIVAISAGDGYTLGLKADGKVVTAGRYVHSDISGWTDIKLPG